MESGTMRSSDPIWSKYFAENGFERRMANLINFRGVHCLANAVVSIGRHATIAAVHMLVIHPWQRIQNGVGPKGLR
jgi:hypothetical protein